MHRSTTLAALLLPLVLFCTGCAQWSQKPGEGLVRHAGDYFFQDPVPASCYAVPQWEFAVLSENAYQPQHAASRKIELQGTGITSQELDKLDEKDTQRVGEARLGLPGEWRELRRFFSPETEAQALRQGLYVEFWQYKAPAERLAVVFRGTEFFDLHDWRANFRWFLRFIPWFEDQYTLVGRMVAVEVAEHLKKLRLQGVNPRLYSTGHSLGGGLAQYFAYALPHAGYEQEPRVSEVFAFDPSPVTGWFSTPRDLREINARNLETRRVFEHGEVLAYVRLALSYLVPPFLREDKPAITEYRYDFIRGGNIISNHSMRKLAIGLRDSAAGGADPGCPPAKKKP